MRQRRERSGKFLPLPLLDSATVLQGIADWNRQYRIPAIEHIEQLRRKQEWAEHKKRAVPYPKELEVRQTVRAV